MNEQTEEKQTHRSKAQKDGCQREKGWVEKVKGHTVHNIVISLLGCSHSKV